MKMKDKFIQKDFATKYTWFQLQDDGFVLHGTDDKVTKPYLMRNLKYMGKTSGTRIPTAIMKDYNISRDMVLPTDQVEPNATKFFVKRNGKTPHLEKRLLVIRTGIRRYNEKDYLGTVEPNQKGFINGYVIEELKALAGLDFEEATVSFNRKDGAWVSIKKARVNCAGYTLTQIQDVYGQALQYYPYDQMHYHTSHLDAICIPRWFWYETYGKDIKSFRAYKSGTSIVLIPDIKDELTGERFDFTKEVPETVEICNECIEAKPELKKIVSTQRQIQAMEKELEMQLKVYKARIAALRKVEGALSDAISAGKEETVNKLIDAINRLL